MAKSQSKSTANIKNVEQYEALRRKGMSKEKAARIANTPDAGRKGAESAPYEQWTRDELYQKAREVGIKGRSRMNKSDLMRALRRP